MTGFSGLAAAKKSRQAETSQEETAPLEIVESKAPIHLVLPNATLEIVDTREEAQRTLAARVKQNIFDAFDDQLREARPYLGKRKPTSTEGLEALVRLLEIPAIKEHWISIMKENRKKED